VKRSVLALAVALIAGIAVFGAAATLGVTAKKTDSFSSGQAATTSTSTNPTDTTAPTVVSREFFDVNTDGKIDQLKVTYNEALGTYNGTAADWTAPTRPPGMSASPASVTISGTQVLLTWTTLSTNADTAATGMTLSLASATAVRDVAGNFAATFSTQSVSDEARPIPVALAVANVSGGGGTVGRPEKGDTVTITWSEALLADSICTSFDDSSVVTVDGNDSQAITRIKDHAAAPTTTFDQLDVTTFPCALNFGSMTLGSTAYVTATRTFAANPSADRTSGTWNPTAKTFQLKLGTASGATVVVASSTVVYTPDPDLADLSGNLASGTATSTGTQF
jgi:hypothetical protein